jgi:DDE superfamily endonuclease
LLVVTHNKSAEGPPFVYQSRLSLSSKTMAVTVAALRRYRDQVGSRWRKLPARTVALIVLAVLRHDQRPADIAAGYQVSASSVRRWTLQITAVLAAQAPRLPRALATHARTGQPAVLLDGTLIPIPRPTDRRRRHRHYSGKHRTFGLLVLAITDHTGNLLWLSAALPGRTAEITAARRYRLPAHLRTADLAAFADLAYTRLDDQPGPAHTPRPRGAHPGHPDDHPTILTGRRPAAKHPITPAQHTTNQLITGERIPVEHAFAHLKNWRILDRLRANHHHTTNLLRALQILTTTEIQR